MALIGNGVRRGSNPMRTMGGAGALAIERALWNMPGAARNFAMGEAGTPAVAAVPNGYEPPYAWVIATRGGGLSAYKSVTGAGALAAGLTMGRALTIEMVGAGEIAEAQLALIVSLLAELEGDGALSAAMRGAVQMAAELAGEGDATAALGLIAWCAAAVAGSGTAAGSALRGTAGMSAEIVAYGAMTPEGVRDAVWRAIATQFAEPGTMGARLNAAGSAGDPWSSVIENGETAAEILRLLRAMAAGAAEGLEGPNPKFRSADGSKVRIDAGYANGARTINGVDGS